MLEPTWHNHLVRAHIRAMTERPAINEVAFEGYASEPRMNPLRLSLRAFERFLSSGRGTRPGSWLRPRRPFAR